MSKYEVKLVIETNLGEPSEWNWDNINLKGSHVLSVESKDITPVPKSYYYNVRLDIPIEATSHQEAVEEFIKEMATPYEWTYEVEQHNGGDTLWIDAWDIRDGKVR